MQGEARPRQLGYWLRQHKAANAQVMGFVLADP